MPTPRQSPLYVTAQAKRPSTKSGFTTHTVQVRNETQERYFATRVHFRSPSHTGLAYYVGALFKPDATKEFHIDVFADDDEEVMFWVSGFHLPPGITFKENSLGSCTTY